ncbi:inositol monophosphatase [Streptomyces sp. A7024]|uniref:inositol-phosphate phosphatase n=1 Tax=Streptomyces coryli TaxID=1128680 RepID=A0A6G4U0V1_9ACTN|nr:inositol monophosphatase family protein [Streptomyces coryli]NGN65008.1 inositol monophosphatase [Streptomyces coryli]
MIESITESIDDFLIRKVDNHLLAEVERVLLAAAAAEIMPRFRQLGADEIAEKSGPHDLVTIADRRAEEHLTRELAALLPGSVVVGEEAVAADPRVYEAIRGTAPVWIVDPVDGTRQFVHGDPGFCTLVSLALGGVVLASWTYAPALGELAVAVRGRGARLNGRVLDAGAPSPATDLRIATSHPDFTTAAEKHALSGLRTEGMAPRPCGSAGLEYLAIARGTADAIAFTWELAWDHAAGLLLVEEAGGTHSSRTGSPVSITGGNALPFTAARDAGTAGRVTELLSAVA